MSAVAEHVCQNLLSDWWERLFQLSEDAQLVCNSAGEIVTSNRLSQRLLNLSPRLEAGTLIFQFFTQATTQKIQAIFATRDSHQETLVSVTLVNSGRLSLIADLTVTPLSEGFWLLTVKD